MSEYMLSKDYFVQVIRDLIVLAEDRKEYFTDLDSAIGDGDHGINLSIGFREVNKNIEDLKIVVNGAGSAGTAITKLLLSYGAKNIVVCDRDGALNRDTTYSNKYFEELIKRVRQLRPIDDAMFKKLAESREVCQEILRVILDDKKLIVEEVISEDSIANIFGRAVILDALCILGNGTMSAVQHRDTEREC